MIASFLELLADVPAEAVERACGNMRQRNAAFPPSAGELLAECERMAKSSAIPLATRARLARQTIRIDRESLQGRAWDEYDRANGLKRMWVNGSTAFVESEWPPGYDALQAQKLISPERRKVLSASISGAIKPIPAEELA